MKKIIGGIIGGLVAGIYLGINLVAFGVFTYAMSHKVVIIKLR